MAYRRTEYSETMEIPQTSRGFFIRNRDALRDNHNVEIYFPRDQRSGNYQTMVIKGGPTAISKARVQLRQILAAANQEYAEFKERKSQRKAWEKKMSQEPAPSHVPKKVQKKPTGSVNPFALLDVEEAPKKRNAVKIADKPKEEFPALVEDSQARKERRQEERRQRIAKRKAVDDIDPTSVKETKMDYASAVHSTPKEEVPEVPEVPVVAKPSMSKLTKMSWAEMALLDDDDE